MKNKISKTWTVPLALLVACIFAYGLLIPFLNFYWDDLPYLWAFHQFGPAGFPAFVASDRPLSAWNFVVTSFLFGENPLGYHILILLVRWLGAVGVWWILRQVWPRFERQALCVALLFAVYPGFSQQPIAMIYTLVLSVLTLLLLSIAGTLWALDHPRWFWPATMGSMVLALAHFSAEYFFALEFLRPALIWLVLGKTNLPWPARLRRTFLYWGPYLVIFITFLVWRVFIFKFPTYQPTLINQGSASPLNALLMLVGRIPLDMIRAGFLAWITPLFSLRSVGVQTGLAVLAIFIVGAAATAFYLVKATSRVDPEEANSPRQWVKQALPLGLYALFIAGFPAWITNLPVTLNFPFNRLSLAFMFGGCLLIVSLVELIPIKHDWVKIAAIAILIGSAMGWHFYNANTYRKDWKAMQNFFWQLTWRAPGLKPGTSLLTNDIPLRYYSDNSLTAPLNWTYAPQSTTLNMPYILMFINVRLGGKIPALAPGLPIHAQFRSATFDSSTDHTLVVFYDPPRCLRVIDPAMEGRDRLLPVNIYNAVSISHPEQILVDEKVGAVPPLAIFDPEPAHGWCYYYEKADLARQRQDWQTIVSLGDTAFRLADRPKDTSERLVFVEGYARAGRWAQARDLTQQTYQYGHDVKPMLCDTWDRIAQNTLSSPDQQEALSAINQTYQCQKHR